MSTMSLKKALKYKPGQEIGPWIVMWVDTQGISSRPYRIAKMNTEFPQWSLPQVPITEEELDRLADNYAVVDAESDHYEAWKGVD